MSCAHRHVSALRTMKEACVSIILATRVIFIFSLMASLGMHAFRIQNPYQFNDCSICYLLIVVYENGIAVVL